MFPKMVWHPFGKGSMNLILAPKVAMSRTIFAYWMVWVESAACCFAVYDLTSLLSPFLLTRFGVCKPLSWVS